MKAMQLTDYDQPLVLRDIPVPTAEAGQVTVKIHTCGLNFGDLLIIKGTYQERPQLPFTLGMEICGTVTEVGAGVTDLRVGDRVASYNGFGGLAEYAAIAADICVPVPAEMSDRDAAAFWWPMELRMWRWVIKRNFAPANGSWSWVRQVESA
mgnify:CR=1 FL=1